MKTEQRILRYIEQQCLFGPEETILVALSGGADSVALLHVLHRAGYRCEAAHCNFCLRGEESDADERFVRQLCHRLGVPLHVTAFDTTGHATHRGISIEMAARELRYAWFEQLRQERNAAVVAVAHHRDDSIETMLLNLLRGTGIAGLLGIRPRQGHVVRPLLCIDRTEVLEYLTRLGEAYVTDSTNTTDLYTRNKIRLRLLPLMQEINPSIARTLAETADRLADVSTIYQTHIEDAKERVQTPEGISIDALLQETAPRALLFELLHPLGFTPAQVTEIAASLHREQPGKQFACPGWRLVRDRHYLLLQHTPHHTADTPPQPPFRLVRREVDRTPDFIIPCDKEIACFDADRLDAPLTCRPWQAGDVFVPLGMTGKKRVSDYLTDRKFSLLRKERQWVLCCGERIAWLVGERTDHRFRITPQTRRIVIYTCVPEEEEDEKQY